jgi:hypothetical protein
MIRNAAEARWWQPLLYLPAVIGLFVLAAGMTYCVWNTSGHSSLDLRDGVMVFGPILAVGLGLWFRRHRRAGRVSIVVAILGIGFGYFADQLGIMRDYQGWISHGLGPKNPHAGWLMVLYGCLTVIALGVATKGRKDRGVRHERATGAGMVTN